MGSDGASERVAAYFTGDARQLAVVALRSYYGVGHHFTGSAFDELIGGSKPGTFTADDLVAVSMLSVKVPPRAGLSLLGGEADELLQSIPADACLWKQPELLNRDSAAWKLWHLVARHHGVGMTIASKLLAAKRPALFPIYDQHVASALDFGESFWSFWQQVADSPSASALTGQVSNVMQQAELPMNVTLLRAIDVVVWMRQHGWSTHDADRCNLGCDFEAFQPIGWATS